MKRLLTCLLLLAIGCETPGSARPLQPGIPADFGLRLGYGRMGPGATRTELAILPSGDGTWELLVRRSSRQGGWPRSWDQSYAESWNADTIGRLAKELQAIGFFDLATQYMSGSHTDAETLTLEVSQWGRRHLVIASGSQPKKLVGSLAALDRILPIRLNPWPSWLMSLQGGSVTRPQLVTDLTQSLAMHRRWLTLEPGRSPLHLDIFALELALGNQAAARRELAILAQDKTLQGLVPELEALLR